MFDLTIFPLSLDAGREQYELPGLHVVAAPRKAARMRSQDQLVLFWRLLTPTGIAEPARLTHAQQLEISTKLAETYFNTAGSVTAGLRAVVARLNEFLLNRNLKGGDGQLIGAINLAALHGDSILLAHAGPTHSFLLSKNQVLHYDDASSGGRGLGLSRQATPRFYQAPLESGDLLILSSAPPASWNAKTLAGSPQISLDHLRRRLVTEMGVQVTAAVIRFQAGKGQVNYWRPSAWLQNRAFLAR